jgi:heptosyltransferase III
VGREAPRILFVTSARLGDAVLSTGVLARLVADHPGAEVWVVCGPLPAPLFRAVPGLKRLIAVEKQRFTQHWIEVFLQVAPVRWDVFCDMRNVGILHLLRAREAYRYRKSTIVRHKVEENGAILGLPPLAPHIWIDAKADAEADALLNGARGFLAVGPTAGSAHKVWAQERFRDLALRLTGPGGALAGAPIAVFASANEREQVAPLLAALPRERTIDLAGKTDPLSAAACLKRAALYAGNDSGLMHIAAATGTPTLGIFGTGNPSIYGPWGPRTAFVDRRFDDDERVPLERSPDPADKAKVMTLLSVDEIAGAAEGLLSRVAVH